MVRAALGVAKPLCVALSLGGVAGILAVEGAEWLGLAVPEPLEPLPVVAAVVLFGFRGALGSARRLDQQLRERDAYRGARR